MNVGVKVFLLTLPWTRSCYPNWIVTEGHRAAACRSEAGLIVDTLPVQTEPSLPPNYAYMYTHTHSHSYVCTPTCTHTCTKWSNYTEALTDTLIYVWPPTKKREQNQLAITALSTGLSPPGSRVLKIKDRVHTACLYHSIHSFPMGETDQCSISIHTASKLTLHNSRSWKCEGFSCCLEVKRPSLGFLCRRWSCQTGQKTVAGKVETTKKPRYNLRLLVSSGRKSEEAVLG